MIRKMRKSFCEIVASNIVPAISTTEGGQIMRKTPLLHFHVITLKKTFYVRWFEGGVLFIFTRKCSYNGERKKNSKFFFHVDLH